MASNKKNRNRRPDFSDEEKGFAAERSAREIERMKQKKEARQNLLLLIGVILILAIVGIVIWVTSGSSDEKTVATATTADEDAAVETTAAEAEVQEEAAVAEETDEEGEVQELVASEDETAGEEEASEGEEVVAEAPEEETELGETEGEETEAEVTEPEAESEGEEAETEGEEAETAEEPKADEITSTTVLEAGSTYSIEENMNMYEEASVDSAVVMELSSGWMVAIENAAEEGNGWHYVSVWLGGAPTYGYIQIP